MIVFSKIILPTILLFSINNALFSQGVDTININNPEILSEQIELISSRIEGSVDYSDLTEAYMYLLQNPVNINSDDIISLRNHHIINDLQLNNIMAYIRKYGEILTYYELANIEGMDRLTIENIKPMIVLGPCEVKRNNKIRGLFKYGKHKLILRYGRILEKKAGFKFPKDSAYLKPGSVYLGDPNHMYIRYSASFNKRLNFGITLEKDAGEPLLRSSLNDSIKKLLGSRIKDGPDFISGFAFARDISIIKKLIVGDFHIEMGQGLTLWSGLSFGKSLYNPNLQRYARGIVPNTSANENRFLRGIATTIELGNFDITLYYSSKNSDANITLRTNSLEATGLHETGLHRTINEIFDRQTLNIQSTGINVCNRQKYFSFSTTITDTRFNIQLITNEKLYQKYGFKGKGIQNYGVDFSFNKGILSLYGEVSYSSNSSMAGLFGLTAYPDDRMSIFLRYHYYNKSYYSLYSNPYSVSGNYSGESNLYCGLNILLYKYLSISGILEYYSYQWLRYRLNSPFSNGKEISIQLKFAPSQKHNLLFRYKLKVNGTNSGSDSTFISKVSNNKIHEFRLLFSTLLNGKIRLSSRASIISLSEPVKDMGYMLYQDVDYSFIKIPIRITGRIALFSTDGWDSRIYTYENDVLYAYTVPALYGNGIRYFLLLRWKLNQHFSFWIRYARTSFTDRNLVGSGAEQIEGNTRSDIKIQLKISF